MHLKALCSVLQVSCYRQSVPFDLLGMAKSSRSSSCLASRPSQCLPHCQLLSVRVFKPFCFYNLFPRFICWASPSSSSNAGGTPPFIKAKSSKSSTLGAGYDSQGLTSEKPSLSASSKTLTSTIGAGSITAIESMLTDISKDFISVVRISLSASSAVSRQLSSLPAAELLLKAAFQTKAC